MEERQDRRKWIKRGLIALAVAGLIALIIIAWVPNPVHVDVGRAAMGTLTVTVDEDGRTRVKDRYIVSAPITGNLARIELHAGDGVEEQQVLARLVPLPPPLLDARTRQEANARVDAAIAAKKQSQASVARARVALGLAVKEAERVLSVVQQGGVSQQEADRASAERRRAKEELSSAQFGARVADHQLTLAQAALVRLSGKKGDGDDGEQMEIISPVRGRLLRVLQESEGVVQAGTPLLEVGDPQALEIVVDVLTEDATQIEPRAPVQIDRWGGERPLRGHVRVVEPSAFTRLSALGVEEQRVNVIIDLDEPYEQWSALGDGYRVEAHIVVWEGKDVLLVPASSVFRAEDAWAAYVVQDKRAKLREVEIGKSNGLLTHVTSGLEDGEKVIAYPGDSVDDGVRVRGH